MSSLTKNISDHSCEHDHAGYAAAADADFMGSLAGGTSEPQLRKLPLQKQK